MIARAKETFHFDGGTEHGGTERQVSDPLVVRFPAMYDRVGQDTAKTLVEQGIEPADAAAAVVKRGPGRPPKAATGE